MPSALRVRRTRSRGTRSWNFCWTNHANQSQVTFERGNGDGGASAKHRRSSTDRCAPTGVAMGDAAALVRLHVELLLHQFVDPGEVLAAAWAALGSALEDIGGQALGQALAARRLLLRTRVVVGGTPRLGRSRTGLEGRPLLVGQLGRRVRSLLLLLPRRTLLPTLDEHQQLRDALVGLGELRHALVVHRDQLALQRRHLTAQRVHLAVLRAVELPQLVVVGHRSIRSPEWAAVTLLARMVPWTSGTGMWSSLVPLPSRGAQVDAVEDGGDDAAIDGDLGGALGHVGKLEGATLETLSVLAPPRAVEEEDRGHLPVSGHEQRTRVRRRAPSRSPARVPPSTGSDLACRRAAGR